MNRALTFGQIKRTPGLYRYANKTNNQDVRLATVASDNGMVTIFISGSYLGVACEALHKNMRFRLTNDTIQCRIISA